LLQRARDVQKDCVPGRNIAVRERRRFLCLQNRDREGIVAWDSAAFHPNIVEGHLRVGGVHVEMIFPKLTADGVFNHHGLRI
jgi:hypothetical protein